MNLYTGNTAETGAASHSTTRASSIYTHLRCQVYSKCQVSSVNCQVSSTPPPRHSDPEAHYPVWLDTVGLDESDARVTNGELVRSLHYRTVQYMYLIQ